MLGNRLSPSPCACNLSAESPAVPAATRSHDAHGALLEMLDSWIQHTRLHANAALAAPMAAYMRQQFPFLGLPGEARKRQQQDLWANLTRAGFVGVKGRQGTGSGPDQRTATLERHREASSVLVSCIDLLWEQPEREFHYTAMELAWKYRVYWGDDWPVQVHRWIQSKSWWDTVDWWAPNGLGLYFLGSPADRKEASFRHRARDEMDFLHRHSNLWMQRSALIFQLKWKENTDFEWLCAMCLNTSGTKEFFLAKAMGWALRQHAKLNPTAVRHFVASNPQLPSLTRREALKHLR